MGSDIGCYSANQEEEEYRLSVAVAAVIFHKSTGVRYYPEQIMSFWTGTDSTDCFRVIKKAYQRGYLDGNDHLARYNVTPFGERVCRENLGSFYINSLVTLPIKKRLHKKGTCNAVFGS